MKAFKVYLMNPMFAGAPYLTVHGQSNKQVQEGFFYMFGRWVPIDHIVEEDK